jgi:hypothetical protein
VEGHHAFLRGGTFHFWQFAPFDSREVVSLRRLLAIRDTVLQRGSVDAATELWLRVAQEDKVDLKDPGVHILCTFLLGQTQSAHCERVFARVVEMQTLVSRRTTFPSLERWMPGRENKLFAA